jgi:hypothetical protein
MDSLSDLFRRWADTFTRIAIPQSHRRDYEGSTDSIKAADNLNKAADRMDGLDVDRKDGPDA